jgi:predicted Fe-S protein YdhL (DUF1289 family)
MPDANEPMGSVPTPCVRNCCLDEDDICLGCYRSISEIVHWSDASEEEKIAVLIRCRLRYKQRHDKIHGKSQLKTSATDGGAMEAMKDASHFYEVEHRVQHAARPGFRINELRISPTQQVPWHYHSNIQDTFYVLEGNLRVFLREPKEEVRLGPGDTYSVRPRRPHLVVNGGDTSATFLVLQGIGDYDFVPLV